MPTDSGESPKPTHETKKASRLKGKLTSTLAVVGSFIALGGIMAQDGQRHDRAVSEGKTELAHKQEQSTREALQRDLQPGKSASMLLGNFEIDPSKIAVRTGNDKIEPDQKLDLSKPFLAHNLLVIESDGGNGYMTAAALLPSGEIGVFQINGIGENPSVEGIREMAADGQWDPAVSNYELFVNQTKAAEGTVESADFSGKIPQVTIRDEQGFNYTIGGAEDPFTQGV